MILLEALFVVAFCAILMRMKGGGIISPGADGKLCSALCFCVLVFGFTGNGLLGLTMGAAWFIGCMNGLDQYVTNLGGYKGPLNQRGLGDHPWVVAICRRLATWYFDLSAKPAQVQRFFGIVGTTIRGLFMGAPLALVTLEPLFLLIGPGMTLAYFAGYSIEQYKAKSRTLPKGAGGTMLGEFIWGGFIGLGVCLWLI